MAVFLLPWVILPLIIWFSLEFAAGFAPALKSLLTDQSISSPQGGLIFSLVDALLSFTVIGFYLRRRGAKWVDLGYRRFNVIKAILLVTTLFISFFVMIGLVYWLIQVLLPGFDPNQAQANEFTNTPNNLRFISLIGLVILPPLVEEPIFRGFIFPAFAKRWGLPIGAVLSSLLFGLAHLQGNISVYTFVIGLLLCFMYTRLGSIVPGILLHMVNNYLAYTALQ